MGKLFDLIFGTPKAVPVTHQLTQAIDTSSLNYETAEVSEIQKKLMSQEPKNNANTTENNDYPASELYGKVLLTAMQKNTKGVSIQVIFEKYASPYEVYVRWQGKDIKSFTEALKEVTMYMPKYFETTHLKEHDSHNIAIIGFAKKGGN